MNDTCSRRHRLDFIGSENVSLAHAVAMEKVAVEHVGDDLHVAMCMRAETLSRLDAIVVDHPQGTKSHVFGIVVVGEGKREVGVQPSPIGMSSFITLSEE